MGVSWGKSFKIKKILGKMFQNQENLAGGFSSIKKYLPLPSSYMYSSVPTKQRQTTECVRHYCNCLCCISASVTFQLLLVKHEDSNQCADNVVFR